MENTNNKEEFKDSAFYLCKALYHVSIAKQYFEYLRIGRGGGVKNMVNGWILKVDYIINNVFDRLDGKSRDEFREEMKKGDVVFHDVIADKMLSLNPQQKEVIEKIVDAMNKGEIIDFIQ